MGTTVIWECLNCDLEVSPEEIEKYLKEIHKLKDDVVYTEELIGSVRTRTYFMQQWKHVVEGIELIYKVEIKK